MKISTRWAILVLASVAMATFGRAGEIVDRIVANVNGHILLQSDWEEELAFEGLVDGRPLESFSPAERKAALDRLIDQELLREQVHPAESAPAQLVAERIAEIRKSQSGLATDEGWRSQLERYGLTQAALEKRLSDHIQLMRLVEARLRPSVQVDSRAVETYYHDQLLPELQRSGSKEVPLPEVFARIKDLLTEQKVTQLLDTWLASLRSESRIETSETGGEENR